MEGIRAAAELGDVEKVQKFNSSETEMDNAPFNLTPLHFAARGGQVEIVTLLAQELSVDLNSKDDLHRTPLHLAAHHNHPEVVKVLLSKGDHVDANAVAMFGITPLHLSVARGSQGVLEVLLQEHPVNKLAQTEDLFTILHVAADLGQEDTFSFLVNNLAKEDLAVLVGTTMVDRIKRTPLHYAARGGHTEVIKVFFHQPISEFLNVNAEDLDGFTPLHLAAREGHASAVEELLGSSNIRVNVKARNQHSQKSLVAPTAMEKEQLPRPSLADSKIESSDEFSPLHLAAREGHKEVVTALVSLSNIDVNVVDSDGYTPLHLACASVRSEVVGLLLEHPNRNVNVEAKDKSTPLHLAVKSGSIDTVTKLLRQDDINCDCEDGCGSTALEIAEREGYLNLVWLLLEKPVEVKKGPDEEHLYSKHLELAVKGNHKEIVRELLKRIRAVAFHGDSGGQKLLHWAADMGYKQLVGHLLVWGEGDDVNVKDSLLQQTPLHYASQKGHIEVVRMLLAHPGIDVNAENSRNETPLHLAATEGKTEVVKELSREKGDRLRATEEDNNDRTALQLAFENGHKDIEKLLLERSDVREYVNGLYRDRQVYVDAANAILVGAALIASVTFAAWLQPPMGYSAYYGGSQDGLPAPPNTYDLYASIEQHPNLRVFWVFNSLSFFFAIATVLSGAGGVLPIRDGFIKEAVEKVRRALLWTSLLLAGSVICVLGAFATAGYAVLPPVPKYKLDMIVTIAIGGFVCGVSLARFLHNLYQLLPDWWRDKVDRRIMKKWQELCRRIMKKWKELCKKLLGR